MGELSVQWHMHHMSPAVLTSVVGGGIVEGQALSAQGRPGLDPGVVVGTILAISVVVTTGLLLIEVVLADLRLLVMCNAWSHIQHVRRV